MLQNLESGVAASALTMDDGSFQFSNLPAGNYLLIATNIHDQVEAQVAVSNFTPELHIRMAADAPPTSPGAANATVSVNQLKLPKKVRKALAEAQSASDHGNVNRAMQKINEALAVEPGCSLALTTRATLNLVTGHLQAALTDAESAVRSDPDYAMAYFVLASVLNHSAHFTDAARAASEGLRRSPLAWQGHFELAQALAGQNLQAAALKEYNLAADAAPPKFPGVNLMRAITFLRLNQFADAEKDLRETLRRQPKGPAAELAHRLSSEMKTATNR